MKSKKRPSTVEGGRDGEPASVRVPVSSEIALEAAEEAVRLWGGEWRRDGTGGSLELPVAAGVRRGHLAGSLSTASAGSDHTTVTVEVSAEDYRLQGREVMVLLMGAFGGLFLVAAPFSPQLFDLIPLAGLLLLLAWFLVVSRLRYRGVVEFLDEVLDLTETVDPQGLEPEA